MQTSSLICNTCQLIGFYIIRIFIENNAQTEWFYPSGYMISIGHKWEVQMMSKMSWWFMSCIHGDAYFLMKFWMKNHCKWINQHMINNNNNDNNTNNNNNSNSAIVLQTWTDLLMQTYESFSKCVCCVITLPPQKFHFSGRQVIFYISCHLHLFTNNDTGRPIIIENSHLHSVFSSVTGTDFVCICDDIQGKYIVFVVMLILANSINCQ